MHLHRLVLVDRRHDRSLRRRDVEDAVIDLDRLGRTRIKAHNRSFARVAVVLVVLAVEVHHVVRLLLPSLSFERHLPNVEEGGFDGCLAAEDVAALLLLFFVFLDELVLIATIEERVLVRLGGGDARVGEGLGEALGLLVLLCKG